jgi:hypothetical protein
MFIVQGKPREPEGIEKATADSREEALQTASKFLNRGFPFVTVVADGRVYTVDEFAMTVKSGSEAPQPERTFTKHGTVAKMNTGARTRATDAERL